MITWLVTEEAFIFSQKMYIVNVYIRVYITYIYILDIFLKTLFYEILDIVMVRYLEVS